MKKVVFPFIMVCITLLFVSCGQNGRISRVKGMYHGVYVSPAPDKPHIDINLDLKQINDTTMRARIAAHHYFKKNLLFSEVSDGCVSVINKDTINLSFVLYEDEEIGELGKDDRTLNLKLLYQNDSLWLLSSSNDKILPDDFLSLHKALNKEDSAAMCFDHLMPRVTMLYGHYLINGPIKKVRFVSEYGGEFTFNEKGIVTSYKDYNGKVENYEIGEDGDGGYYSNYKAYGSVMKAYSYNYLYQLTEEISNGGYYKEVYFYDYNGRMASGYSKGYKTEDYTDIELDARGAFIGWRSHEDGEYTFKHNIHKVDDYGNPLELTVEMGYGYEEFERFSYEYYE